MLSTGIATMASAVNSVLSYSANGDFRRTCLDLLQVTSPPVIAEMDMGWVHPWVGLGWVAFSSTCDGLG